MNGDSEMPLSAAKWESETPLRPGIQSPRYVKKPPSEGGLATKRAEGILGSLQTTQEVKFRAISGAKLPGRVQK